jgi:hypothetical protein
MEKNQNKYFLINLNTLKRAHVQRQLHEDGARRVGLGGSERRAQGRHNVANPDHAGRVLAQRANKRQLVNVLKNMKKSIKKRTKMQ